MADGGDMVWLGDVLLDGERGGSADLHRQEMEREREKKVARNDGQKL